MNNQEAQAIYSLSYLFKGLNCERAETHFYLKNGGGSWTLQLSKQMQTKHQILSVFKY